jgi:hypothetical protein
MAYVVGIVLSVGVALLARSVGFDRDRAFYPTVLIVIASYYVLFAAMRFGSNGALGVHRGDRFRDCGRRRVQVECISVRRVFGR